MRYLLTPIALFTFPLAGSLTAAPILDLPDEKVHYQMRQVGIPPEPQKRMPTAGELAGLDAALFDFFSTFDWFTGPLGYNVRDSNSAGAIVGDAYGPQNAWVTDFLYVDGQVRSTLLDATSFWDINEAGVAVGGNGMGLAMLCQPGLASCVDGNYLPRTKDPLSAYEGNGAFELFTHIDNSGNIWGVSNFSGVYLQAQFNQPPQMVPNPEPSTWIGVATGVLLLWRVRKFQR